MYEILLQATHQPPVKSLPVEWQNYIIWILAVVIIVLAGYIARQYDKRGSEAMAKLEVKHDEAMKKFDGLIKSNTDLSLSLTKIASALEKIYDNDKETKWALQNQEERLTSIEIQLKNLSGNIESTNSAIRSSNATLLKLTKKLKCQEETA